MSKAEAETAQARVGLVEQFKQNAAQQRHAAAECYRELLLRSDEPRAGDAAILTEVMGILGRGEDDLEGDVELVRRTVAIAQAQEQLQALLAPLKEAGAEQRLVAAWADEQRSKLEAKIRERAAAAGKALGSVQAAHTAAAGVASEGQQVRDLWAAIVAGLPLAEIRAARRRQKATLPRRQTREEIIDARRHETVGLRLFPTTPTPEGMVERVNAALAAAGHTPLSDNEIVQYGIRSWLADADNRPRTAKELEAQKGDAQVAHAE